MPVPGLLRHQVDCDDSDYRGKSIGAICQECLGKDCPSTPAKATTTTTTTTTTTPMTTFAKPDDCVTNSDGACFFLSTTEVLVTSPNEIHILSVLSKKFPSLFPI